MAAPSASITEQQQQQQQQSVEEEEQGEEEEESEEPEHVPYSQRAEWADVQPLHVDDGSKVAAIQYSEEHMEALAYFRAIIAKGEKSERALELTRFMISLNSADYTAWEYRWDCLMALGSDLQQEYQLTSRIAQENVKNYQLWNHRRKLAAAQGPSAAARELAFANSAIEEDSKNYHAWAHRQSVVAKAGLWEEERAYSEALIRADVRNNSAWNQRMFVLQHTLSAALLPSVISQAATSRDASNEDSATGAASTSGRGADASRPQSASSASQQCSTSKAHTVHQLASLRAVLKQELEYVAEQAAVAPRNESPWNYLWGLFALPGCPPFEMARHQEVYIISKEALSDCPSCAPALDTLAQYYLCLACLASQHASTSAAAAAAAADAAAKGRCVLGKACIADPLRAAYWRHRQDELAAVVAP